MPNARRGPIARVVRAIDRSQRRRRGIAAFSGDPRCILRLGLSRDGLPTPLPHGVPAFRDNPVGVLHLWNEHVPQIPPEGPTLAWARAFKETLAHSLHLLARHIEKDPALADVTIFAGVLPLAYSPGAVRLLRRLGMQVSAPIRPHTLVERVVDAGSRLWAWLLRWAFNPASARSTRPGELQRRVVWIDRRTLVERYL